MSCNWKVSSDKPWFVSDVSASSATADANATRSLMIASMVSRPTIARSEPASTSCVNTSIAVLLTEEPLGGRAYRVFGAPTLTMATPSREHLMPCALTAPPIATGMRRDAKLITCSFCTSVISPMPSLGMRVTTVPRAPTRSAERGVASVWIRISDRVTTPTSAPITPPMASPPSSGAR